jgi:hypothetical protein
MIGTIRKHSAWLWYFIAGLTIISFVWWGTNPGTRNGGPRGAGYGVIYGKPVTKEEFDLAQREYLIYYWRGHEQFPGPGVTQTELARGTYERIILIEKAKQLGIHVSDEAQVAGANQFLRSLSRDNQTVPLDVFIKRVLEPEGLDAADFQRFIAHDLAVDQLIQSLGLSGTFVTPQEASQMFDSEHQEVSAQAVFFSGTNYLSQIAVTPAAVAQFYTNAMALYRVPDRVQIHYIEYDLTNFLGAAEQKLGKTNVTAQADAYYAQKGPDAVPDAKTPAEAKARIREMILRQAAAGMAVEKARDFQNTLFAIDPAVPENLVAVAKTNGLTVHTTAPFTEADGPEEFAAPEELTKEAFKLNADSPFAPKPISGAEAVYVIGLDRRLPSEIPPLSQIRDRVTQDYRDHEAALKARAAGTNFYYNATVQMALGKTFAQVAVASHESPQALAPFSLSSQEIPIAEGHAEVRQIKNAAFTTAPGHISPFEPTADGGFVLYVQSLLPVNETDKKADLPRFIAQLRRGRESEAFNLWLNIEENRELRNTPVYDELTGHKP